MMMAIHTDTTVAVLVPIDLQWQSYVAVIDACVQLASCYRHHGIAIASVPAPVVTPAQPL